MHTQSIRKDIHDRCIQQQQDLAKKQSKTQTSIGRLRQKNTQSISFNDDLEEFIKIVKIDSFEIAILNLLHQPLQLCEQGPTS